MERWREQQEAELQKMVDAMRTEMKEKSKYVGGLVPPSGWFRVASRYICKRFQYLEKPKELIPTLASTDDEELFLTPVSETVKGYVRWIRDYAKRYSQ